jgi:hypothetical protein
MDWVVSTPAPGVQLPPTAINMLGGVHLVYMQVALQLRKSLAVSWPRPQLQLLIQPWLLLWGHVDAMACNSRVLPSFLPFKSWSFARCFVLRELPPNVCVLLFPPVGREEGVCRAMAHTIVGCMKLLSMCAVE